MSGSRASYRPGGDIFGRRWSVVMVTFLGAGWIGVGLYWWLAGDPWWFGPVWFAMGVLQAAVTVAGHRARVEVDEEGLRWRGVVRSSGVRWADVETVVLDDRGPRFGSKVAVTLHMKHGGRLDVPSDALAGLERPSLQERRERLLGAVGASARQAGVIVRAPGPHDPLVS